MNLLTALREATRPLHTRIETSVNLMHPDFSPIDYRHLLTAFLGFYRPLEDSLQRQADIHLWLPDYARRIKTPLLEKDLAALGLDARAVAELPVCDALPDCSGKSRTMGCLYVLEGSTLGGQMISRHLKHARALDAEHGAAFFNGYGADTGSLWKTMLTHLEAPDLNEGEAVSAATDTFVTLTNWLTSRR